VAAARAPVASQGRLAMTRHGHESYTVDPSTDDTAQNTVRDPDDTGAWAAVKRFATGAMKLPGQLLRPADTPEETALESSIGTGGHVATVLKRALIDPGVEASKKADEYTVAAAEHPELADNPVNGYKHMANMYRMGAAVPVIGPMAASMTDRFVNGDPYGAMTEGALVAGTPAMAKGAGRLLKSATGKALYPMADTMTRTPTGTGEITLSLASRPRKSRTSQKTRHRGQRWT
jgi:hypothetical protein